MVKIAFSFISGVLICGLLLFGVKTVIPTRAETDDVTDNISDNVTQTFLDLLPDIEAIYRESLIMPFEKAEAKIYDEDIAEYYGALLDRTGLRAPSEDGAN
jgi:hypothetical protein